MEKYTKRPGNMDQVEKIFHEMHDLAEDIEKKCLKIIGLNSKMTSEAMTAFLHANKLKISVEKSIERRNT